MKCISEAPMMLDQLLAESDKDKFFSEVPKGLDSLIVEFTDIRAIPCPIVKSPDQKYIKAVEAHYGTFAPSADDNDDISVLKVSVTL